MADVPSNANAECVGPSSEEAGKSSGCEGCPNQSACASGEMSKPNPAQATVNETMSNIGRTVLVLSGKGGVGKSTTATQLAFALARQGKRVGLLDLDICGPSVPHMLGLSGREVHQSASGWSPVYVEVENDDENDTTDAELGVMSIGFLMPDPDSAVIWRGPRKNGLIQQFFTSVDWGELDYLLVDTPPGTSDEHISIVQLLKESLKEGDGAIVVTTPQEVAMLDVRKELNFCKQTGIKVLGVVENMSTAQLPVSSLVFRDAAGADHSARVQAAIAAHCPELASSLSVELNMFPAANGGPEAMAQRFGVPLLGRVPLDTGLQQACELGVAMKAGSAMGPLNEIVKRVIASEPPAIAAAAAARRAAAAAGSSGGVVSVSSSAATPPDVPMAI